MVIQDLRVLIITLGVPLVFVVTLWWARPSTRTLWLSQVIAAVAYVGWLVVAGRWDWVGYPLRFVFPILLLAAAVRSWRVMREVPWWSNALPAWVTLGVNVVVVVIFANLLGQALWGLRVPGGQLVSVAFPLRDGTWYVAHGGSTVALNYHHVSAAQRYALDLTRLGPFGTRAAGLYPAERSAYYAFETPVYSPCDGLVVDSVEHFADLPPSEADPEHPAGNHVVIRCNGVDLLLAHLRQDSVSVDANQAVTTGERIAQVGNTGNTSEPHLHIHAVRTGSGDALSGGEGVPLLFAGRFLVRNDLVTPSS
jgi:hypothetical protein